MKVSGNGPVNEQSHQDMTTYLIADDPDLLALLERVRRPDEQVYDGTISYLRHALQTFKTQRRLGLQLMSRRQSKRDWDFAESVLPGRVWAQYEAYWMPAIVFLDLAAARLPLPTRIHDIRSVLPASIFVLYSTDTELVASKGRLGNEWAERLSHYYVLRKPRMWPIIGRTAQYRRRVRALLDRVRPVAKAKVRRGPDKASLLFMSYSHLDAMIAEELEYRLHFEGYEVWIDVQTIAAGDVWNDAIKRGLEQAKLLILAVSRAAVDSAYVQREYTYFLETSKPIIPILISEGATLPEGLASLQAIDFTHSDFELNFRRLLAGITKHLPLPE